MGALGFLLCQVLATAAPAGNVAVFGLQAKQGVSRDAAELLTDRFTTELKKAGRFQRLVGTEEISAALSLQQQQQLLDCTSASCMAELAGALAVEWVLMGSVGRLGEQWLLNVKLVDARSADAVVRVSRTAPGNNEGVLLGLVESAVTELLVQLDAALLARQKGGAPQEAAPVPAPAVAQPPPPARQQPLPQEDPAMDPVNPEDDVTPTVKAAGWPTLAGSAAAGAGLAGVAVGVLLMTAGVVVTSLIPSANGSDAFYVGLVGLAPGACSLGCLSCTTGLGAMVAGAGLYASRLYFRREGGPAWRRPGIALGLGAALLAAGGLGFLVLTSVGVVIFGVADEKTTWGAYKAQDVAGPLLIFGGAACVAAMPALFVALGALAAVAATDVMGMLFLRPDEQ